LRKYSLPQAYKNFTVESPFVYASNSSIGCGGVAKAAFFPRTQSEIQTLTQTLKSDGVSYRVLGNLTNVLPPDGVGKTLVISTKRLQDFQTEKQIYVSAGVTSATLMRVCSLIGKSGAEFLAGIPCSMGGALYMNAGVNGRYIAEIVESVRVLIQGKIATLSLDECLYGYKTSVFMRDDFVILGANLRLVSSTGERVKEEIKKYVQRRAHLPKGKSMGCVFKNPQGETAGKLIEGAGLKGLRIGGAKISPLHANFIINDQHATSKEIKDLIEVVKNAVFAQYKIKLQEEIQYLE